MIRVMIADDHPVVRDGLRDGLTAEADMEVIAEAGNGIEAEQVAMVYRPDVILMDLSMPHRNGIDTMAAIKRQFPQIKVLILTVSEQGDDLARAVRLGADGYLLKNASIGNIVAAVRKVAAGESILSPDLAATLMKGIKEEVTGPPLSARETEVLQLLAEGLTTSGIAKRLRLSSATVGTYVNRLMEKLHLKNRASAIIYAARHYPATKK